MSNVLELRDDRIDSTNYIFQITIEDYIKIAKKALDNNEFQRKRIKNSNSVYTLLKEDLQKGCIIPPIVLAITDGQSIVNDITASNIEDKIKEQDILILDGLQRTLTLLELTNDLTNLHDFETLQKILNHKLRIEVYVGLNKLGILYRMLTLNTGQTPMSLRQQTEMLYLSYSDQRIDDIKLLKENDSKAAIGIDEYKFNDIVEGFNSYLERNELPLVKADLLENIRSLEKLSKEDTKNELFTDFVKTWHKLVLKFNKLCDDNINLDEEREKEIKKVYFKNILTLLKKPQSISAFGAAIGKLIDYEKIKNFNDVENILDNLVMNNEVQEYLFELNKKFEWIDNNSKKIGNAQRMFLQYYFRDLFNNESENYLMLFESISSAFNKYKSQNF